MPPAFRGKYKAFLENESNGVAHLKQLAAAGMTHLHLLPFYDCGTINEDPLQRTDPDPELLATFPGDSLSQQEIVGATREEDSWNWCCEYTPFQVVVRHPLSYQGTPYAFSR